jgi:hypothetical protein
MIWHTAAEVARKVNRDPCTVRRAAVDAWVQGLDTEAQRAKCGCVHLRSARIAG